MFTATIHAQAATQTAPLIPEALVAPDGSHWCWKRTVAGWVQVPAPWGSNPPGWLWTQPKRIVWAGGCGLPDGDRRPLLQAWEVGEEGSCDPEADLICDLQAMPGRPVNVWWFLCERPALASLAAEYAPMLTCECGSRLYRDLRRAAKRLKDASAQLREVYRTLFGVEPKASLLNHQ